MNKTELIKAVSKKSGVTEKDTRTVINNMIEVITNNLVHGINVKVQDFANFTLEVWKEKKGSNPRTGEAFIIPKRYMVKTVLSKNITEQIKAKPVY